MKKVVLITGTRGGIGLNAALRLARRGHRVIATVHREESIATVEQAAREAGVGLEVFKLDIRDESDRRRILDYPLDVLVNNAAIGETGPLAEVPLQRVRDNFETNVFATLALTQLALADMIARGRGQVVIVGSLGGRLAMPFMGPYVMTKFALEGAVDALRVELRPFPVYVSIVEPGAYATGFNEKMHAKKYEWMGEGSLYRKNFRFIRFCEKANLRLQGKRTGNIVRRIVKAVESRRPCARYTAPWWQALGVRLIRIFT